MMSRLALPQTLRLVIALNVGMFVIESAIAFSVGSVSLIADSVDFLEDASINLLVLVGLAWSARSRARLGMGLAAILLAPSSATLVLAWARIHSGAPSDGNAMGVTGLAALSVNLLCAWLLARHHERKDSLLKAAYLSARNDTMANLAIIVAAVLTVVTRRVWPDLVVGLGIGCLNAGAAWEVWQAARVEHRAA